MAIGTFTGRSILIVEDEPIIAFDISQTFEDAGATTITASTMEAALRLVEKDGLSAAVLDFGHDAHALCARLRERSIPFVLHSGSGHVDDSCCGGVIVPKPAATFTLVAAVAELLRV